MARALGFFGLGGGFLAISPKLRLTSIEALSYGISKLDQFSPYSYIAAGLGTMVIIMIALYRGSAPR